MEPGLQRNGPGGESQKLPNDYEPTIEEIREFIRLPIQVQILKMAENLVQYFGQFAIADHNRYHCCRPDCCELNELIRKLNNSAKFYEQVIKEIQEIK